MAKKAASTSVKASEKVAASEKKLAPLPTHRKIYGLDEVSAHIGLSARILSRYCKEERFNPPGKLGQEQVGGKWIIWQHGLEYFLKQPRERGNPNFGSV